MSLLYPKQAETEIPLSPEEKYEASKLIGRSLFSAMQLARLQEERRNKTLDVPAVENEQVLNIPIPASLMPVQKVAADEQSVSFLEHADGRLEQKYNPGAPARYSQPTPSSSAYEGLEYDKTVDHIDGTREHFFKPKEGKGISGHVKRNIGKYVGAGAGGLLAASMKGKARLLAPLAGLSLGKSLDDLTRSSSISSANRDTEAIEDSLAEIAIRQRMMDKNASILVELGLKANTRKTFLSKLLKAVNQKILDKNLIGRGYNAVGAALKGTARAGGAALKGTARAGGAVLKGTAEAGMAALPHIATGGIAATKLGLRGGINLLEASPEILKALAKGTAVTAGVGTAGLATVPLLLDAAVSMKKAEDDQLGFLATALNKAKDNPIRMLLGGQTGFRDAKKEYYFQQKAQMQKELMDAQKEYIDVLQKIKTGADEDQNTPCVDAFCNGIAHYAMFGKTAEDTEIADGSLKRMLGEIVKKVSSPIRPAAETAASGLLNTAAGTAYLTYMMRKRMREEPEKYMEQHLPTRVELQPY
jgi:hypothetical protein